MHCRRKQWKTAVASKVQSIRTYCLKNKQLNGIQLDFVQTAVPDGSGALQDHDATHISAPWKKECIVDCYKEKCLWDFLEAQTAFILLDAIQRGRLTSRKVLTLCTRVILGNGADLPVDARILHVFGYFVHASARVQLMIDTPLGGMPCIIAETPHSSVSADSGTV